MKKFIYIAYMAVCFLTPFKASAGSFYRYGLGVFNSAQRSRAEVKAISFGYEEELFGPIIKQYEVGAYFDTAGDGRTSSGFGNFSIGVEVTPGYFVFRSVHGVGAITNPDSMLGGWFEFNNDLMLGVQDSHHNMIALNYKHISSAGIYNPNKGRDFLLIHVEIPW